MRGQHAVQRGEGPLREAPFAVEGRPCAERADDGQQKSQCRPALAASKLACLDIPEVAEVIKTGVYDRIIFTKDTHQSNYLGTQEGKRLPVVHCIEGTEGWEIAPVIRKAASFYSKEQIETICKPAFGSVQLGGRLKQYCGDAEAQIDFCGVRTGICVISNVMIAKAFVPEARVCVIEKACACVTPESHRTAIEAMKTCQVDIQ